MAFGAEVGFFGFSFKPFLVYLAVFFKLVCGVAEDIYVMLAGGGKAHNFGGFAFLMANRPSPGNKQFHLEFFEFGNIEFGIIGAVEIFYAVVRFGLSFIGYKALSNGDFAGQKGIDVL